MTIVGRGVYRNGKRMDLDDVPFDELADQCLLADDFSWIGLYDPTQAELDTAGEAFGIHPLALEDAKSPHERPKVELIGDTLTIVLRSARYLDETESVEFGQITLMCSTQHILVVRLGDAVPLTNLRRDLEAQPERLADGPGVVAHRILDTVVEAYLPVLSGISDDILEVEDQVFSDDRHKPTERIYKLKREVLEMFKAAGPLVDVLGTLRRLDHPVLSDELHHYLDDTNDDLRRVMDQLVGDRELLTAALEANLTQVSIRQNEDMRKMSAWAAIIAVPTAIAGIYGMNFDNMPELSARFGYPIVLGIIAAICLFLYYQFKRSGWI